MKIISDIEEMIELARQWRAAGESVGLVPTMGYLHAGHLSLIRQARADTGHVVVSIFVNPTQFGPNEDFLRYPRDLDEDKALCEQAGVDVVFTPRAAEMYPENYDIYVEAADLSRRLCGRSRPGHFRGVCTVVLKLWHIVQPHHAYFGQKDAQQFLILERMARDLNIAGLVLHQMPIIREADGLALSSRNVYLSAEERRQAPVLRRALLAAERLYAAGERQAAALLDAMRQELAQADLAMVDYLEIVDTVYLKPVAEIKGQALVALAVYFGRTRLIDNILLGEK
ncbi:MAG: pantoate--beta-alanine ligase [Clostridia bacterium]|nr:pantoate--beta-alanine ligase [Clostridia bacterium]